MRQGTSVIILTCVIVFLLAAAFAVGRMTARGGGDHAAHAPAAKAPVYFCPMHPTYTSPRPGTCPICHMDLVLMKPDQAPAESSVPEHAMVTVAGERRQLIGLQVAPVETKPFRQVIRAAASVQYNEKTLSAVTLKTNGWIEDLKVKAVGDVVRKGEPLLTLYSPEVLEAQRNYLAARAGLDAVGPDAPAAARDLASQSLRSARERLLLLDITEEQIKSLDTQKTPSTRITLLSRSQGVVISRNVLEGAYVEAGRELLQLADLSNVWVYADIYEPESALVKPGMSADLTFAAFPGEHLTASVEYLYPMLNDSTRTIRARLVAPNPEGKLKPGMYGTARLTADLGDRIVVPDSAILDTGERQIVYVDVGEGRLEPRTVKVGLRSGGVAVILEGLEPGEKVVTSGNFLVDSESRLRAVNSGKKHD